MVKNNRPDLSVSIGKLRLKNPVMVASGTFGNGEEYEDLVDLKSLGAIVSKTITMDPRKGNPPPRIIETPSGMLNAIGLENKGAKDFIKNKLPFMKKIGIPVIVSIAADDPDGFAGLASLMGREDIAAIELNLSCPNLNKKIFSHDEALTSSVIKRVRAATDKTIIAKLSPNSSDVSKFALIAQESGADCISLINTLIGMAVDIESGKPSLGNVVGGLSGPAIKPVALRIVWEAYKAIDIPIIGMGGIMTYRDALEFIICGAAAISVGTANFIDPETGTKVLSGIEAHMRKKGVKALRELRGVLKVP